MRGNKGGPFGEPHAGLGPRVLPGTHKSAGFPPSPSCAQVARHSAGRWSTSGVPERLPPGSALRGPPLGLTPPASQGPPVEGDESGAPKLGGERDFFLPVRKQPLSWAWKSHFADGMSIYLAPQCPWPLSPSSHGVSSSKTTPPHGVGFFQNTGLRVITPFTRELTSRRQEAVAARPLQSHT